MELTQEQKDTLTQLRAEVEALNGEADKLWEALMGAKEDKAFNYTAAWQALAAVEGELQMKELIAHIPKAGERKVSSIRALIDKVRVGNNKGLIHAQLGRDNDWAGRLKVLESINDWRDSLGLPPLDRIPRGIVGDPQECAIAKALKQEFNNFRTIISVDVNSSATVAWEEVVPFDENMSGNYYQTDEDRESGTMRRTRDISRTFNGQGEFISDFDGYEFLDLLDERDLRKAVYHWIVECNQEFLVECWKEYHRRFDPAVAQEQFLAQCDYACKQEEVGVIFFTDGTRPDIYTRERRITQPAPFVVIEDGKGNRVWPLADLARFSDNATKRDVLDMDYDD